jgi:hypothetical protein
MSLRTECLVHVDGSGMCAAGEVTGEHGLYENAQQHEDGECQSDASGR